MAQAKRNNPSTGPTKDFIKKWDKISEQISVRIRIKLGQGKNAMQATKQALRELDVNEKFETVIMEVIETTAIRGGVEVAKDRLAFREWYLHKHWPDDKFSLSQRIAKQEYAKIIANTIEVQLRNNATLGKIAKSITDKELVAGDISKTISELSQQARRVATGDRTALQAYQRALKEAKRNVANLAQKGAPTENLKKAYENVIRASEKLNVGQIDRSVVRAVKRKARYNAERIARTEGAKAYGMAAQEKAFADSDVVALRWLLSPDHPEPDICDFHAGADIYGLGDGVYPKHSFPAYPAHPHCLCIIDNVYGTKQLYGKFDNKAAENYLKNKSAKVQKNMMGVEGRKEFLKDTKSWRSKLNMYQGKQKDLKVPEKFRKE